MKSAPFRNLLAFAAVGLAGFLAGVFFTRESGGARRGVAPVAAKEPGVQTPIPATVTRNSVVVGRGDSLRAPRSDDAYSIELERPGARQHMEDYAKRASAAVMARGDAEYRDLFAALGVPPDMAEQLKQHLGQIIRAKAEATVSMSQLVTAQMDYDKRVRDLLGEKYQFYKEYELGSRARRETDGLRAFAGRQGVNLAPGEQSQIEELIKTNSAYSFRTLSEWGSPYHSIPTPVGGEALATMLEERLEMLARQSEATIAMARDRGIGPTAVAVLDGYYRDQLGAIGRDLARVRDPALGLRNRLLQQLATLRNDPSPNPGEIARVERVLTALGPAR